MIHRGPFQPLRYCDSVNSHLPLLCLPAQQALICPSSLCLLETSLALSLSSSLVWNPAGSLILSPDTALKIHLSSCSNLSWQTLARQISCPEHPIRSPQDLPSSLVVHLEIQYSFMGALNHFVTWANEKKMQYINLPYNERMARCCGVSIVRKDLACPWLLDSH